MEQGYGEEGHLGEGGSIPVVMTAVKAVGRVHRPLEWIKCER